MKKLLLYTFLFTEVAFSAIGADDLKTSFFTAVKDGDFEQVQQLVEQGASVFAKDENGSTALMWAACGEKEAVNKNPFFKRDYLGIAKFLVKRGVAIEGKNAVGISALWYAVISAQLPVLRYLILKGADMGAQGDKCFTALHFAVSVKDYDTTPGIEELIKSGACLDARDSQGRTPLILALQVGCEDRAQVFINAGADLDVISSKGYSALAIAAYFFDLAMVKRLVEAGADVEWRDTLKQLLPLSQAIKAKKLEVVDYLISVGAPVNASDQNGMTALMTAACLGDLRSLKSLLDAGAKRDAQNNFNNSALFFLMRLESVEDILAGIKLFFAAPGNRTLLVQKSKMTQGIAPLKGVFSTMSCLINMKNQLGLTALMSAVDVAKPTLVQALLEYPVLDKEVRADCGQTALDLARMMRDRCVTHMHQGGVIDPLELANKLEIVALLEKPRHAHSRSS